MTAPTATVGAATPTAKPAPATPAATVKINPTTISWVEPKTFVTDNTTFTSADFDSYEFGQRPAGTAADYAVVAHMPAQPGVTTVAVGSLNLPRNAVLQVSVRIVASNGVRSSWCVPPVLLKLDSRVPQAPSGLVLA